MVLYLSTALKGFLLKINEIHLKTIHFKEKIITISNLKPFHFCLIKFNMEYVLITMKKLLSCFRNFLISKFFRLLKITKMIYVSTCEDNIILTDVTY